jgi:GAF domain-containing protein
MAFALQLKDSLRLREAQVPSEFEQGDALGTILSRYLLAVEAEADSFILTSILLVDGKKLRHGAAPTLPPAYIEVINGSEYGPCAGSCGTAAYLGRPVYVTDIATDPLWADYKQLALPHGLRACWSTPIFDDSQAVIGTFAIYHLTTRGPTQDEIDAIREITDHVARAISWSRSAQELAHPQSEGPLH